MTLRSGGAGPRRALERAFQGQLLWPGQPEFETSRLVENAAYDCRPALIARVAHADDVSAGLQFARDSGLPVAVRSGGHSVTGDGTGDGVVLIDLSQLSTIEIDVANRTAWAGAGTRAWSYINAADAHGLATPFGDSGSVGLGGLTLGGGIGWLVRKHGLTIDSLLAVEIVTADGRRRIASERENTDLFWAVRGGGGNFGIVTRMQLRLYPLGPVLHGSILLEATRDVLGALAPLALAAPDELTIMPSVMAIPPMDEVPAALHGKLGVFVDVLWSGEPGTGAASIDAFRALGQVLYDDVAEKRYPGAFHEPTGGRSASTTRATFLDRLDDEVIDVLERHFARAPDGDVLAHFRILGGAAARVPAEATAFGWRDETILLWIIADVGSEDATRLPPYVAWADGLLADLRPFGHGRFVSFMGGDEGSEPVSSAYPAATWDRLREVKHRYDPDNVFRHNRNIPPA